jgi:protein-disulfide isomerase
MAKRYDKKQEAARLVREQQQREQKRKQMMLGIGIVAVVVVLGAVVAIGLYLNQGYPVNKPKAETSGSAVVLSDGPVTVDLYEDFICPACKQFQDDNGEQIEAYAAEGQITLNFHPLGLLDGYSSTKYSSRAAAASVCAADEDKFLEYKSSLFAKQPPENTPGLTDEELITIGEDLKLGKSFKKCVQDEKYRGWIDEGTNKATADGITSTPTMKIDGKDVESSKFMAALDKAIEAAGGTPASSGDDAASDNPDEEGKKDDENSEGN